MAPDDLDMLPATPSRVVPNDVRLAIAHMRDNVAGHVTATELAQAAGVTGRTLRRHFVEFLGQPPLVHFRRIRLAAARAALLAANGDAGTVTEIASRFGFAHFGRFSADYRRQFGELPSATRARGKAAAARSICLAPLDHPHDRRQAPSIVVFTLRTPPGLVEERLFAEALAEHLAAMLTRAHGFSVRLARQTGEHGAATRAASERYCLSGHVTRPAAGGVRVVAHLTDRAAGDVHLWGDAFEGVAANLPALHARVVEAVVRAIRPSIEEAEIEAARRKPTQNLLARDLVLRAMPLVLAADPASAARALTMLEDAIALDPDDPAPVALAGWCRMQFVLYHTVDDFDAERARAQLLADRAAALDPLGDPLVLTARGGVAFMARRRGEADALLARAHAIDPGFGWAWERRAWVCTCQRQAVPALALFQRAIALKGKRTPMTNCFAGIGTALFDAGRYEKSAWWVARAMAENPGAVWFNRLLAPPLMMLDERRMARGSLDRLLRAYPDITRSRICASLPNPAVTERLPPDKSLVSLGLPA